MKELEDKLHKYLSENASENDYEAWLANVRISDIDDKQIILTVPNQAIKDWIEDKLFPILLEGIRNVTDSDRRIQLNALKSAEEVPDKINIYKSPDEFEVDRSLLIKRYTFDNFVVGKSNQLAHAAAVAVAKHSGQHYNPLFIYGASGLGKTHLMQAIGNYIKRNDPSKKVGYMYTEMFMNEKVDAIKTNSTLAFRNRFRNLDVLLLDDIHWLEKSPSLQEEIFHTFDALYHANKQIVLTADRLPREIPKLQERLVSRFQWGLVVDIQEPDFETRLAILRKKVESENIQISDEILNYISNNIKGNVRMLEGALLKMLAMATLTKRKMDVKLAREVILGFSDIGSTDNERRINITADEIIDVVSQYYKVPVEQIMGRKRSSSIVLPRHICIFLIRKYSDLSLKEIAEKMNRKDHSTIIHSVNKIEKMIVSRSKIDEDIQRITGLLNVE